MYKMKNKMTWTKVVDWLGDYLSEDEFDILTYAMDDLDLVGWLAEIKVTIRRLVMLWEYQWGCDLVADEGCKVCGGNGSRLLIILLASVQLFPLFDVTCGIGC